jgi:hypothetical protein
MRWLQAAGTINIAGTVAAGNQVAHEVEGCDAAGAGDAVAVDDIELLADGDVRILVAEHGRRFPMQGDAIAFEQPGLGEGEDAGVDGAEYGAVAGQAAQPVQRALAEVMRRMVAGADEDRRKPGHVGDGRLDRDCHAVAGLHGSAVGRKQMPAVELAALVLVGDAQRLDRRDERVHREFR